MNAVFELLVVVFFAMLIKLSIDVIVLKIFRCKFTEIVIGYPCKWVLFDKKIKNINVKITPLIFCYYLKYKDAVSDLLYIQMSILSFILSLLFILVSVFSLSLFDNLQSLTYLELQGFSQTEVTNWFYSALIETKEYVTRLFLCFKQVIKVSSFDTFVLAFFVLNFSSLFLNLCNVYRLKKLLYTVVFLTILYFIFNDIKELIK